MLPVALKCLHDSCHKHFFLQGSVLHLPVLQDAGSSLRMDLHMGISANCLGNSKARKENWFLFLIHVGSQLHATVCLTGSLHQVLRIVCSILLERNVNKGSADTRGALSRLITPYSTNIQAEKTAFMFKEVGEIWDEAAYTCSDSRSMFSEN